MHVKSIQLEIRPAPHRNPPNVRAGVLATRHHCFHEIASLKPKVALLAPPVTHWEATGICPAHLPCSVALGRDHQHAAWSGLEVLGCRRAGYPLGDRLHPPNATYAGPGAC